MPSYQLVVAQTPIAFGSIEFGGSRTIAFVLRCAKKSVGLLPSPSPPTAVPVWSSVVVPMKPVRSKKNGSERTPAQAHSLFWPIDFVAPFVVPWATVGPPLSDAAWLPV